MRAYILLPTYRLLAYPYRKKGIVVSYVGDSYAQYRPTLFSGALFLEPLSFFFFLLSLFCKINVTVGGRSIVVAFLRDSFLVSEQFRN